MTVQELIEQLKKFDENKRIIISIEDYDKIIIRQCVLVKKCELLDEDFGVLIKGEFE
jgi:hypothetical protein